ncbi:hypothetical protein ACWCSD_25300, partial [Nonomuraea sp. NPDC001684]
MAQDVHEAVGTTASPRPRRELTTAFVVSRIAVLAVAAAILLYAVPPLVAAESWVSLTLLGLAAAAIS